MITEEMLKEFDVFRSENMATEPTEFHVDILELAETGMVEGLTKSAIQKVLRVPDGKALVTVKLVVALFLLTGYRVGFKMGKKEATCPTGGTT